MTVTWSFLRHFRYNGVAMCTIAVFTYLISINPLALEPTASGLKKTWVGKKSENYRIKNRVLVKVKGNGLDTCYRAAYMSQTRDQQCFTILEVAADWHS